MTRSLTYILELCGWALIIATIATTIGSSSILSAGGAEPTAWDYLRYFGGMISFVLEGLILGLIAILIARLARHPDAKALGQQAATLLKTARTATGKDDA